MTKRRYDPTYCHYCQQYPHRASDGYCSDQCRDHRRQIDADRYHKRCSVCHGAQRRPGSWYCSEKCESIAEATTGKHVKRNPAHNKACIETARCPECGELISALKDCRCQHEVMPQIKPVSVKTFKPWKMKLP